MPRVAGADPGTSSLDLLVLEDGAVVDQVRFAPPDLQGDPALPARWLLERGPFDRIAGPSGYGVPLLGASACREPEYALMSLQRPDDVRRAGLIGLRALQQQLAAARLPVVFLPGVIHLPTVPVHRKLNHIDLGTPDKLAVAALALASASLQMHAAFCVVEVGSAFTACLVVQHGAIVHGLGGSSGPYGWQSGGAWDGEAACWLAPLAKRDLFTGGVTSAPTPEIGKARLRESLLQGVAGLQAVVPFGHIVLSGRLLEQEPTLAAALQADLAMLGTVSVLESLPGAWVKHAAQGAAVIADGLAGGRHAELVQRLALDRSSGTVLDWLCYRVEREV